MISLSGIAVSTGIAIAKAYRLVEPDLTVEKKIVSDVDAERLRFESALFKSSNELEIIRELTKKEFGEEKAGIFSAHLLLLKDPEMLVAVNAMINQGDNAEYSLQEVTNGYITLLEKMDNDYMKERAADVRDVTKRVLSHLLGVVLSDPTTISEEVIIIADDLTPSITAQLNKKFVKGFVTNIGGRTSHSAILARILDIPAVVGTNNATTEIADGVTLIIDGAEGVVISNPDETTIVKYKKKMESLQEANSMLIKYKNEPTLTMDGHKVELAANIGTLEDVNSALQNGCEGIGLVRTEFLYMGRDHFPTEEDQYEAYKAIVERMKGKPVVFRTMDIGGDKELSYLNLPDEMNPFLGFRAIRICLAMTKMFRTQLRALLRASVYGNLKIMFPMIATMDEFRQAKRMYAEEKESLLLEGIAVSDSIEVGMMVEIPSAAIIADLFAKEADFLSIGTNDLIQYTLAADRMNEKVSYLYQPYHPAILRLVKNVIDAAHREGKWAGMCGEMAGDEIAIPILLALGLDEFSMSASSILRTRAQFSELSKSEWENHIRTILSFSTSEEVETFVKDHCVKVG